ncbi:hypothetical protein K8R33_01135 [archaeon]|nr:hypothetical protein [archaeon]
MTNLMQKIRNLSTNAKVRIVGLATIGLGMYGLNSLGDQSAAERHQEHQARLKAHNEQVIAYADSMVSIDQAIEGSHTNRDGEEHRTWYIDTDSNGFADQYTSTIMDAHQIDDIRVAPGDDSYQMDDLREELGQE